MKRPRHTKRRKAAERSASSSSVSEAMRTDFMNKLRAVAEKARGAGRAWLRAALAVVLVLGTGFAAIFPEAAGRYGRVIFTSNRVVPLPDETRRAFREKAKQLAAALDSRLDRKRRLAGETWTSAQVLVALRESDPGYASRIDVK